MISYLYNKIFHKNLKCNDCSFFISHKNCLKLQTYPLGSTVGFCNRIKDYFEPRFYKENICIHFKHLKKDNK